MRETNFSSLTHHSAKSGTTTTRYSSSVPTMCGDRFGLFSYIPNRLHEVFCALSLLDVIVRVTELSAAWFFANRENRLRSAPDCSLSHREVEPNVPEGRKQEKREDVEGKEWGRGERGKGKRMDEWGDEGRVPNLVAFSQVRLQGLALLLQKTGAQLQHLLARRT